MALSIQTLALAKKYTDDSLVGLGALKGASCTIQDIVKENGMNKITFEWVATDNTIQTSELFVKDGTTITNVEIDNNNELIVTLSDNTSLNGGKIKTIQGNPGFSPKITENINNTDSIYKLDIETENGIITTPNLMQGGIVSIYEF